MLEINFWASNSDNARIDTLAQNSTTTAVETAADAFLNWVRDQEYQREYAGTRSRCVFFNADGETNAAAWITFFVNNMGMFLRNAAIYNYPDGMVHYFQGLGTILITPITIGSPSSQSYILRLTPNTVDDNEVGDSLDGLSSVNIEIYGWLNIPPSVNEPYWLLVRDKANRVVWVAAGAVQHNANLIQSSPETDFSSLDPSRDFIPSDLQALIGDQE